jgi:hypothetical protein
MAARALELWQENEWQWNLKLFFRTGALWMAGTNDPDESAALPLLKEADVRFEKLPSADCAKGWPQIKFEDVSWCIRDPLLAILPRAVGVRPS